MREREEEQQQKKNVTTKNRATLTGGLFLYIKVEEKKKSLVMKFCRLSVERATGSSARGIYVIIVIIVIFIFSF